MLEYPEFIYDHYKIYPRLPDVDFTELTCIDFGCGDYRSDVAKQVLLIPFKELTSIEGYDVDYESMISKTFAAKKHIPIKAFIPDLLPKSIVGEWEGKKSKLTVSHEILNKKYDVTLAFDVIEHLERKEAIKLMEWVKSNCKYALFYVPEEPEGFHRVWEDGNALQAHISHWTDKDFTDLGFKVERDVNAHSDYVDGKEIKFDALWVSL